MKMLSIGLLCSLTAVVVLGGCTSETDDDGHDVSQTLLPLESLPPRPALAPGESNWADSPATLEKVDESGSPGQSVQALALAAACPSLSTTDLNSLLATDLVDHLLGNGPAAPVVSNVSFSGANLAAGTFSGGSEPIGFESGVILGSGNIASVVGPNALDNVTTNNGLPGDADLDGLVPGFFTLDATVLEFDFECPGAETLAFRYVFSSDEYNEYVNSQFNDVFGFFVNGTNVAIVPGTATPVAINNVNCGNPHSPPGGSHCDLFVNNDLSDGGGSVCTEMDGLTAVLTAEAPVQPGVNHIRLAIGDAGDQILDSNVFLEAGSFTCNSPPTAACQDVTVPADAVCSAVASVDNGSSDPDGDELNCVQSPPAPYPLGTTEVTLTCTDPFGESDSCTANVTVEDVTPPEMACPGDQTAECVDGGASVQFDDPTASDNCALASVACEPPSGTEFALGDTAVECVAADEAGNSSLCSFNVAVEDTIAPLVSVEGGGILWPPNHKYVTKTVADCGVEIADQCQGLIDLESANPMITCVTSDEPEDSGGDGVTLHDMVIVDATTVQLRSEREDSRDGRVYRIHFEVSDDAGNVGEGACEVSVPGDLKDGGVAVDSGVQYSVGTCD